jgi:hypothetical protein
MRAVSPVPLADGKSWRSDHCCCWPGASVWTLRPRTLPSASRRCSVNVWSALEVFTAPMFVRKLSDTARFDR